MKAGRWITILAVLLAWTPLAWADFDTYTCSLKVTQGSQTIVNIEQEVRISRFANDHDDYRASAEAFEGLRQMIAKKIVFPGYFIVKAVNIEGSSVPELNIGFYKFNKFQASKMEVMHSASGDARTYAKLSTTLNYSKILFSCRNKNYLEI